MNIQNKIAERYRQDHAVHEERECAKKTNKEIFSAKIADLYQSLLPIHGCTFYEKNMCAYTINVKLIDGFANNYIAIEYGKGMFGAHGGVNISQHYWSQDYDSDAFHVSAWGWFHWNYSSKAGECYFLFNTADEVVDWIVGGLSKCLLDEPKEYKPSMLQKVTRFWRGCEYSIAEQKPKLLRDVLK